MHLVLTPVEYIGKYPEKQVELSNTTIFFYEEGIAHKNVKYA